MKTTRTNINLFCVSLMLINLIFVSTSSAQIDFNNCVGMWLFNEGSGSLANDTSGKGNDGKIEGGANWVNGKFGKALSLDGSNDYVEIAHDDSLMVGSEHTIALWFKLDKSPGDGMGVVTKDDWAPGFWWNTTIIRHHTHDPAGTLHYIDANWNPDTNWHHVAATWDGDEFGVYLDGDEIGSGISAPDVGRNPLTDKPLLFGIYLTTGQHGKWGQFLSGIIDDVAIFNVALSEGEIKSLMTVGLEQAAGVEPSNKLTTTWANIKN